MECLTFVLALVGIGALVVAWRAHSRLEKLERAVSEDFLTRRDLVRKVDALRADVARLAQPVGGSATGAAGEPPEAGVPEMSTTALVAAPEEPSMAGSEDGEVEVSSADEDSGPGGEFEPEPWAVPWPGTRGFEVPTPRVGEGVLAFAAAPAAKTPGNPPRVAAADPGEGAAPAEAQLAQTDGPADPLPNSPPSPPPPPAGGFAAAAGGGGRTWAFDWESLVGVRLFSWIAGIALVLAALFFLRYSIDQGWLTAPVRMALGLVTGIGLLVGCELKAARRYPVTANALDAAGVAILYATLWASHAVWNLVGALAAFGFLALVTAVAVMLSIRRDSVFIALLGLVGGFASPALLSAGEDRTIGLFGYLLLLNAGLAWVAYRKRWPILTGLSLVFTTGYQLAWALKFLSESRLSLAAGIFLAFPALGIGTLLLDERRRAREGDEPDRDASSSWFSRAALVGAVVPLLFVLVLAAVPAYGAHVGLLFGLLGLLSVGLFLIAALRGPEEVHLLGGAAVVIVFGVWLRSSYAPRFWPLALALVAPFIVFQLTAPLIARWIHRPFRGRGERGALFGALLFFAFPALTALEPASATPWLLFGVLIAMLGWAAFVAIRTGSGLTYYLATAFGVATEVVWSALRLTPERRYSAMGIYGLLAVFYLGVPYVARRRRVAMEPRAGASVLLLASLVLLLFLTRSTLAGGSLLGLTVLILLLNLGLLVEGRAGRAPEIAVVGGLVTWAVLAFWWRAVPLADHRLAALLSLTLVALLLTAGGLVLLSVLRRRVQAAPGEIEASLPEGVTLLGLGGHAFLLYLAANPALSLPPGPLLAVLIVLDLALIVAALYARQGWLAAAALAATQVVLSVAQGAAPRSGWPSVALLSALAVGGLGVGTWLLAERLRQRDGAESTPGFLAGAFGALLLGFWVAIHATAQSGAPGFGWILGGEALLLGAILAVSARSGQLTVAVAAVVPAVIAVAVYQGWHTDPDRWRRELLLAAVLWSIFLAFPLLFGRRFRRERGPFFAAILAGAGFFLLARAAMLRGGLGGMIGALPVFQAALLAPLLVRLVRIEPPAERDLTRLATLAGSILAFVTVAIPMQLDKQWITLGWALLGAALVWLYGRVPHPGLIWWAAGLEAAVFARLALNPAVLDYHPRQGPPILNWFLYTYLVAAAAMFFGAWKLGGVQVRPGWLRAALASAGTLLLFLLLNIEIADFFSTGSTITFGFLAGRAGLSEDLAYTIGWALFAIGLLVAGLVARRRAVRLCAIVLLVLTILKAFLHDTWRLGGLYRVGSLVGLAVCLALVAIVLQKFVLTPGAARKGGKG